MGYLALTVVVLFLFSLSGSGMIAVFGYALLAPMIVALVVKYLSECLYAGVGYSFRELLQRIVLIAL